MYDETLNIYLLRTVFRFLFFSLYKLLGTDDIARHYYHLLLYHYFKPSKTFLIYPVCDYLQLITDILVTSFAPGTCCAQKDK